MNKRRTPLVDKVLSDKEVPLLEDLALASMDFKIRFKAVEALEARVRPSVIYSMSSKRCLEVSRVAAKEGRHNR